MTKLVYFIKVFAIISFVVGGQALGESKTKNQHEQTIKLLNQKQLKIANDNPKEMINHWKDFVSECDIPELKVEAQYYISRIISGKIGESEYLEHIKKTVENYTGDRHHLLYLRMFMTYGQVIAPELERQNIFRQIMTLSNERVVHPVVGHDFRRDKKVVTNLVRGAVWAELQEKTRKIKGLNQRTVVAQEVGEQLLGRSDGKELSEHVNNWVISDQRRLSPNNQSIGATHKPLVQVHPIGKPKPQLTLVRKKTYTIIRDPKETADENGKFIWVCGIAMVGIGLILSVIGLMGKLRSMAR